LDNFTLLLFEFEYNPVEWWGIDVNEAIMCIVASVISSEQLMSNSNKKWIEWLDWCIQISFYYNCTMICVDLDWIWIDNLLMVY
jgi:hypothetical protein